MTPEDTFFPIHQVEESTLPYKRSIQIQSKRAAESSIYVFSSTYEKNQTKTKQNLHPVQDNSCQSSFLLETSNTGGGTPTQE